MADTPTGAVSVLVISAHPDDADISSGGTVARWAREGCEIHYVLCTSGNRGSNDPEMTPELLGDLREGEQRAAAEILGVTSTTFLRHEDCEVEETLALRKELAGLIRQFKPTILMTHDPSWASYSIHPDHRAVGSTSLAAIMTAGNQMYRESLPHHVSEVYLFQTGSPDYWVELTATDIDIKVRAIGQHKSQGSHSNEAMMERVREWAKRAGEEHSMPFAEGFKAVRPPH